MKKIISQSKNTKNAEDYERLLRINKKQIMQCTEYCEISQHKENGIFTGTIHCNDE